MVSLSENEIQSGLRANWRQFTLLVIVNAFVGAMVGLERTIVPLIFSSPAPVCPSNKPG
jgi:hypothetical protein